MRLILPLAICFLLFSSASCEKEEGPLVPSGVSITFRSDSGYVSADDTVPQSDTLRFHATFAKGGDDLVRVYLSSKFDGGAETWLDTAIVDADPFGLEAVHVTRTQAGSEQIIFTAEETDGDRTTRRLTFTVE
jgi:hypothetical protein